MLAFRFPFTNSCSDEGQTYGGEAKRVHLDTQGGHVLLLEFTSQVTLDKGGLEGREKDRVSRCIESKIIIPRAFDDRFFSRRCGTLASPHLDKRPLRMGEARDSRIQYLSGTAITDKHELEGRGRRRSLSHVVLWLTVAV